MSSKGLAYEIGTIANAKEHLREMLSKGLVVDSNCIMNALEA